MPVLVTRFAHDSGIVTAAGQDEGDVGVANEVEFEYRTPWRDVVLFRRHRKYRRPNVAQHNRLAVHLITPFEQVVVEEEATRYSLCMR